MGLVEPSSRLRGIFDWTKHLGPNPGIYDRGAHILGSGVSEQPPGGASKGCFPHSRATPPVVEESGVGGEISPAI
eukprot:4459632-Pyramimonas_sp.AAC.1